MFQYDYVGWENVPKNIWQLFTKNAPKICDNKMDVVYFYQKKIREFHFKLFL